MAFGLFITILLLFHQISSSIQQSDQVDPSTSPNDRDEILSRDRRTLKLVRTRNQTESKLVEARAKICGLETEIECEQKERSDEFTKINSKISQNDDRSTKIGAELKEIDSKVTEMSRAIYTKMAQIETDLMGKIAKLEADLVDERERNRELKRKIAETKMKNDDLEAQFARERNETKDKDVEMSRLTAKMAQIETDLMGKIAETKRKNDDLEAQLKTQNTEVRDGKVKIGELEGKINALQNKNSGFETQINRTMTFLDLDGWSYLAKTASWYKVINQRMSFDPAEAYCASRKSHLVSIHSQEENDFVQELAKDVNGMWGFWIGLKRNPNQGNAFEWRDWRAVDFTNWKIGQPDSGTHALLDRDDGGKWWPWAPTSQFFFICERSSQF